MICPLFQLAALAVLTVASAANTFVGCRVDLDDPFPGFAINTPSTEACAVSPNGPGVKATACYDTYGWIYASPTSPFLHSFYGPYSDGANCHCSTDPQYLESYTASATAANPTVCADAGNFSVLRIGTSYTLSECFVTVSGTSSGFAPNGDCFSFCGPNSPGITALQPQSGDNLCVCDVQATSGSNAICGLFTFYTYSRTQAAAASGILRRRERVERKRAQAAMAKRLCPMKRVACIIPGSDSYEASTCIDPLSELESCGGCVNGVFGASKTTTSGTDCSALPGARLGSYSCSAGRCVATRCDDGYTLSAAGKCEQ
ncbi:uncharacterized protein MKK02DRAFT_31360 [Dioszegia hungarica]|uniref:Protein CPL1-like domain-containing protein n=1 Tax=Dioszegia hungarica TaxID=4972 RepID=A0AA38HB17_9TREE|nr:uncharacterized protein MKK02DRAFT_31360 [Dioszegia hungarica]KAI9637793.1 hypothetical protein MKK02DRAFT_31360 [Dioszegia hungarica]